MPCGQHGKNTFNDTRNSLLKGQVYNQIHTYSVPTTAHFWIASTAIIPAECSSMSTEAWKTGPAQRICTCI